MNIVGHAVQRRAAISLRSRCKCFAASKLSPGKTMVAPVAAQPSTPSTMPKQWYSGTGMHSRSLSVSAIALALSTRVVDDVAVGKRRALGRAGRAAGELDVDRSSGSSARAKPGQTLAVRRARRARQVAEGEHGRPDAAPIVEQYDVFQRAAAARCATAASPMPSISGASALQNRHIVARLERAAMIRTRHRDFLQRVFQLDTAIGGIDVDQDCADARGTELCQQPFDAVRCPDPNAVAARDAKRQESSGHVVRAAFERRASDKRSRVGAKITASPAPWRRNRAVEQRGNRHELQRLIGCRPQRRTGLPLRRRRESSLAMRSASRRRTDWASHTCSVQKCASRQLFEGVRGAVDGRLVVVLADQHRPIGRPWLIPQGCSSPGGR